MSAAGTPSESDVDALTTLGQQLVDIILARSSLTDIRALIDAGAPLWYQDEDGTSALHAAAYIEDEELIRTLIEEGALWNAVDNQQNTAADIALSFNNEACYHIIRDAGVRSELLLELLSKKGETNNMSLILKSSELTAAGSLDTFLETRLRYTKDANGQDICMVNTGVDEVGVMMGWERPIMQQTVHKLCDDHPSLIAGLKILNVGFGLGIIDTLFESTTTKPALHVIIEPHTDVLEFMRSNGWFDKSNVKILEGKWQDFASSEELLAVGGFDVIYTDTFSEDYQALRQFFELVPDLLSGPHARFSFFNGLGATNSTFYDVYTHLSELHLEEIGLDTEWIDVRTDLFSTLDDPWGETRKYFTQPIYRLPIAKMKTDGFQHE